MRWMALLLLLVLTTAAAGAPAGPDDRLIVPGQRIGKWTLQMTYADLRRLNGPERPYGNNPAIVKEPHWDSPPGIWGHVWWSAERSELFIAYTRGRDGPEVILLEFGPAGYRTAKGITDNSPRQAVEAAYGKPGVVTKWRYADIGGERLTLIYDKIGFSVRLSGGQALHLGVFRPGTAKRVFKF